MKKISLILTLCLGLAFLAGCSGGTAQTTAAQTSAETNSETAAETATAVTDDDDDDAVLGGWQIQDAESVLSDEEKEIFDKASEGWVGAEFEPVAVIATQVVAGTNYCYLAKVTTVTAQPSSHYAFVYIYNDLEGNAKISDTEDIEIDIDDDDDDGESTEGLAGGWTLAEFDGITVEHQDVLTNALEGFVGSKLAPIACIATQVVSGTNYCFIVKETRVTAEPVSYIALVYVYENTEGKAEILNIHTIDYMPED